MTKIKDRDRAEFEKLWKGPASLLDIAAIYGVTRGAIQYSRKRFGLPSRANRTGRPRALRESQEERV